MKPQTVTRDSFIGDDTTVSVTFTYWPLIPGRLSGPPENCYPDEGHEVEIDRVMLGPLDITQHIGAADIEILTDNLLDDMAAA